jgi:hypothetical protein
MKAISLAASSVVLALLLQPGCGSNSPAGGTGASGGAAAIGGDGGTSGSGGAGGAGATSGAGGTAGTTAGTGGSTTPDAASTDLSDAAPGPADATGGGSGGGGNAGGTGGVADGGPAAMDTWETFAQGFFGSYCVSCHNDDKKGVATRDYHVMANVVKEKAEIACGVAKSPADATQHGCSGFPPARQFPVGNGPKPSDAERDRLVRWIDSGTP